MNRLQVLKPISIPHQILLPSDKAKLEGELFIPNGATGMVIFVQSSNYYNPYNQFIAKSIREAGIGTLTFNLLTKEEEVQYLLTNFLRFNIMLLVKRLVYITNFINTLTETSRLHIGYFGTSAGGGTALMAAAKVGDRIRAVVSHDGRPDLAGNLVSLVKAPTLFIVDGYDKPIINITRVAYQQMECVKESKFVPGINHQFEEPNRLENIARLSTEWFHKYL
ncbi:MAG: alpha/beta hydrolase [Acidobacteriota bacterium]